MWSLLNSIGANADQDPHKHNSVALDLAVSGGQTGTVYSLLGRELNADGTILNPVKAEWKSGGVFVTPPGWWHSHHNKGNASACLADPGCGSLHSSAYPRHPLHGGREGAHQARCQPRCDPTRKDGCAGPSHGRWHYRDRTPVSGIKLCSRQPFAHAALAGAIFHCGLMAYRAPLHGTELIVYVFTIDFIQFKIF